MIRRASASDLGAVRDLLSQRDERAWDDASTRWFLRDLDPAHCVAWLAVSGERPVGLSTLFLRELNVNGGARRAGYWANLYIDPAYRDQMLYPRLPLAMFAESKALGLAFIYGSVRIRDIATAHTRIGFAKLGEWRVLLKPLRPFRLLGKHRRWDALAAIAAPFDAIYRGLTRLAPRGRPLGITVEEMDPAGPIADAMRDLIRSGAAGRITDTWSAEAFRARYGRTREGGRYVALAVRRAGTLAGVLVYRIAERSANIHAGVVMDVLCARGEEPAMGAALDHAERHAHREGCEVMLFLNGLGGDIERVLRVSGYLNSPERYDLLVWPKTAIAAEPELGEFARWRFGFGDHDAF